VEDTSGARVVFGGFIVLTLIVLSFSKMPGVVSEREHRDMRSLRWAAAEFDTRLRSQAAAGTRTDPNDTDPRQPVLLLAVARHGDFNESTASTALRNSHLRVLMWQGAGQASVKWTRISCPSGDCSSINPDDGTLVSAVGENSKLYNPEPRTSICLQFHLGDQNLWMNVTSSAEPRVVADVLETACPASVFPGITAATGTTYADLSATPGAALVDPTW
jgi:hypothetical protein